MSGGDGYLNLKTYRTMSRMLTNAGLDHRVETMTKHYKIIVDTPMGERSFLLGHGPNPKTTTERASLRQIDKLIAEVRAWREAHADAVPSVSDHDAFLSPEPSIEQRPTFDLALHVVDDEPRVLDIDLALALGISRPTNIRTVIEANSAELATFGPLHAANAKVAIGSGAHREVTTYHLNEEQALLIALLSRTEKAKQARAEVIRVFTAWRRGALVQAQPELSGEMRQAIGGITKSVVRAAFTDLVVQLLPDMVSAHLAKQKVLVRHGKTAGQIWDRHGLPKLKSAAVWLGNRLSELGCQIEGRGERGAIAVRLFDPDKAEIAFRNGLLLRARQYVAERQGQGRLRLLVPGSAL